MLKPLFAESFNLRSSFQTERKPIWSSSVLDTVSIDGIQLAQPAVDPESLSRIYGTSCYTDGQNSDALRGKVQPQVGYFCAGSSAERVTALKPKPGWSTQVDRITAKLVFL